MDISNYTSFFHDGSIGEIQHDRDGIVLSMSSAQMDEEDNKDNIPLSKDDFIQGKLHIEGIKSIIVDDQPFFGVLKKTHDSGGIFRFELRRGVVELMISWENFRPKPKEEDFTVTKIEAENIWWENIPDLVDFS